LNISIVLCYVEDGFTILFKVEETVDIRCACVFLYHQGSPQK
jgi:hypothetical protein